MDTFIQDFIFKYINPESPQGLIIWIILLIWSIVWKGLGLWKSARNNETLWFVAILFLNTLGILEIAYLFYFAKDKLNIREIIQKMKTYKLQNPFNKS